jgi:cation-transporting P-type ATPase E
MDPIPGFEAFDGLTTQEAATRRQNGESNRPSNRTDRTVFDIIRANVFTRFNAILGALLLIIIALGPSADGLFGIILIANVLVGVVQEVRAKRTLDHLSLISAATVPLIRDGNPIEVASFDVVRGDVVGLRSGAQIVADGPVLVSNELEVDESLLTGEAEPQTKAIGDDLRSGSFVVAGSGWFRAEGVGDEAFANAISAQARKFVPVKSELAEATDTVLRLVTWGIGPIAAALLLGQRLGGETWRSAIFGSATGVVEIVPEGFVLLTSMTLALSVIRLGRVGVLVKELAAVEGLARVNTICFDKTGTLTEGKPVLDEIVVLDSDTSEEVVNILCALTIDSTNATAAAIRCGAIEKRSGIVGGRRTPFSSARKWAAIETSLNGQATWILGAPEIVLFANETANQDAIENVESRTASGKRVLVLAQTAEPLPIDGLPTGLRTVALVSLVERIRPEAAPTLRFFAEQGVQVKIISGDNPGTVAAIARAAGMANLDQLNAIVDAGTLFDDDAANQTMSSALVVGRSSPQQKKRMVESLKFQRRTVAMTGDGVNDVLALKVADLAIAMGSGSEATRAVAQIVLVKGDFASLPGVVAEGRRVIANVERVAKLFITKTIYAAVLAIASGIARIPFPFLPRQLTLVSALTIGTPGFFLAFARETPPAETNFLRRVIAFSVPAGVTAAVATLASYLIALHSREVSIAEARTTATLVLSVVGLWIVSVLARPLTKWREVLLVLITSLGLVSILIQPISRFWKLDYPPSLVFIECLLIAAAAIGAVEIGWRLASRIRHDDEPDDLHSP